MFRTATVKIIGASPLSMGRPMQSAKNPKETADAYEQRCWRERVHADDDGKIFMPGMAFKNCLSEAAKFLSKQIPGKGKSTYTKHFEAGVMVIDPMYIDGAPLVKDVPCERLFVPADGQRGGSKRVWKYFPVLRQWSGEVKFHVVDETITNDVFVEHLRDAGMFIGVGRFRPRNNGYYGRFSFEPEKIKWTEGGLG